MRYRWALRAALFVFVIGLIAVLAWLTTSENQQDPCASQQDVNAAVLAEPNGDQDALVNRAIILRGRCKQKSTDNKADTEQ